MGCFLFGAGDRDRTGTRFTARDFKSLVSACSTTPASYSIIAQFYPAVKKPLQFVVQKAFPRGEGFRRYYSLQLIQIQGEGSEAVV